MRDATAASMVIGAVADLPRHETERLLQVATGRSRSELIVGVDISGEEEERFLDLVERRLSGEPLQYIEGVIPFGPVDIEVDVRVLIPRPETEQLYELAVAEAPSPRVIVDLCTGSGNVALALKHSFPGADVYASEISVEAAALAGENASRNGLAVLVLEGDLFDPMPAAISGRVDLVTANPPYVASAEVADLAAEVRDHEPAAALVAGPRGVEVIARIASSVDPWLSSGGVVVCEIGESQRREVLDLFAGFSAAVHPDLTGRDRFLVARRQSAGSLGA